MRLDSEYLDYAAQAIDLVAEWTADGREFFLQDVRTQAAMLYELQTLTQALRDMTPERRSRYPEVPFRAMSGFRTVMSMTTSHWIWPSSGTSRSNTFRCSGRR